MHKKIKKSSSNNRGFALIASLVIMVLLVMITVGMLSLSTSEVRKSKQAKYQLQAQANARVALQIALGQLQNYAGQDTRVTANASVQTPTSANPHWVGVFKTRPDEDLVEESPVSGRFVVDHHEGDLFLTDIRQSTPSQAITYLVSGNTSFSPNDVLNEENSVQLLNTGDEASSVRAPLVKINNSNYAYWISDNSVKALFNHADPFEQASSESEKVYSSSIAQSKNLDSLSIDGLQPTSTHSSLDKETLDKALTNSAARIVFSDLDKSQLKKAFHTITSDSASVFSNTMVGGLKHDLTSFIENGDTRPSSADVNKGLPELLTSTPIIKGGHHNMTSPKFGVFKHWADMRFDISGTGASASLQPQAPENSFFQTFERSLTVNRRDLTNHESSYIQPVVVEASLGWDFSPHNTGSGEVLRTHLFPRLTLWNPYNVTLEARQYLFLPNTAHRGLFRYRGAGFTFRFPALIGMPDDPRYANDPKWSTPGFVTVRTSLAPGECKVFTPDTGSSSGGRPFSPTNFAENVLSADNPPGSNNFYHNTTRQLTRAETPGNATRSYGFDRSRNNFYGDAAADSDEFIVLQYTGEANPPSVITHDSLSSDNNYQAIAHFLSQTDVERRFPKWYAAENSQHASNGMTNFEPMESWDSNRLPPRLWRRGIRLQWLDESSEYNALPDVYSGNEARLTTPLLTSVNIHGGLFSHPSPLDSRFQQRNGWQSPYLNAHLYFRQPSDPAEFKAFFPPSPIGRPGDGYPSEIILFDIPRENPGIFSLGQFQHAQFSYHPYHPTFILGSSYSTRQANLNATALHSASSQEEKPFLVTDPARWSIGGDIKWGRTVYTANNIIQSAAQDSSATKKHGNEVLIYDIAYELNHSIWDHYMLSSIPYEGSKNQRTPSWDGKEPLPVSSYKIRSTKGKSATEITEELRSSPSYAFYHSAEFLMNHGALNVNCDNPEVWEAFLLSLKDKQHPNLSNEETPSGVTSITRSLLTNQAGSTGISGVEDSKAWNAYRALEDSEITTLANEIVKQVRQRGPFMSVSDFINRQLSENSQLSRKGALQSAIDLSGINATLEVTDENNFLSNEVSDSAPDLPSISNRADFKTAMLPGYFSQQDLITVMAPTITARGDTFTIRAYGEARDSTGNEIKARAYCEAIVQRVPEFVDSSDDAITPVRLYNESSNTWEVNSSAEGLSKENLQYGRKFIIKQFRWLRPSEV